MTASAVRSCFCCDEPPSHVAFLLLRLSEGSGASGEARAERTELVGVQGSPTIQEWRQGGLVTRRTYGILAGVIGFGAWWWARQRNADNRAAAADRGTVIFRNTPAPTPLSTEDAV